VIAGSNAYVNNIVTTPPGYTAPYFANNASINAPLDCNGQDTYLGEWIRSVVRKEQTNTLQGYKLFADGAPFNIQRCAAACTAQTDYNFAHPPAAPANPKACTFFDTYILSKVSAISI